MWDIPLVGLLCCDFKTNASTMNENELSLSKEDVNDNAFPVVPDTQGQQVSLTRQSPC